MERVLVPLVAMALLVSVTAHADSLRGTEGQPLREASHDVVVTSVDVAGGVVRLAVTRVFHNDGYKTDEAQLDIDLPEGAVAFAMRVRATDTWYDAVLVDADVAEKLYEQMNGKGPHKDPALLMWTSEGNLELRVFPVVAGSSTMVSYELVVPLSNAETRGVTYAWSSSGNLAPRVVVKAAQGVDVQVVPPGDDDRDAHEIRVPLAFKAPIHATYSGLTLKSGRHLVRATFEVAPVLGVAPVRSRTIFVVDASKSEDHDGIWSQIALVRAYLAELPDAEVELVLFRRRAERLFGKFVTAVEFERELRARLDKLHPKNGSNLEEGIALAAGVAAQEVGRPVRIVVTTDALLREKYPNAAALRSLASAPKDAIVHVVASSGFDYDDNGKRKPHALEALASTHGGAMLDDQPSMEAHQRRPLAAHLVLPRYVTVDVVEGGALGEAIGNLMSGDLSTGSDYRLAQNMDPAPPKFIRVRGAVWSKPFEVKVEIDRKHPKDTAALSFGNGSFEGLYERDIKELAYLGHVVSPVTSLLSTEPGTRPSFGRGGAGYGSGTGGLGSSGRGAGGSGAFARQSLSDVMKGLLQKGADACFAKHGKPVGVIDVYVETTLDEVVDVIVNGQTGAAKECLEEAAWALVLDHHFTVAHSVEHVVWTDAAVECAPKK